MNKKASIVIVCMNNLKNLIPCLNSIKEQTTNLDYDIWVVAYLFSKENLELLRNEYSDVVVVESNQIRGFSENNNLALRKITSEYILVLNDDTLFKMPVLNMLIESMEQTPEADMMGCKMLNEDGSFQSCGKDPATVWNFLLMDTGIKDPNKKKSVFINQKGIFQSYNCTGACFLIKKEVLKDIGFFDEYYFFMPEDLALSTKLNKMGYKYYVNSDIILFHLHQQTGSKIKVATLPAARKGCIHFYAKGNKYTYIFLSTYVFLFSLVKSIIFKLSGNNFNALAQWHCVESIFSQKTPKEIFIQYYMKLKSHSEIT